MYRADTGIYYRVTSPEGEAVTAGGGPVESAPGTLLYTF